MEPIVIETELDVTPEHAFAVWTDKCSTWWPRSHSMSESSDFKVIFEPFPGGRVFELGPDGSEYEWGVVVTWEPPYLLEYRWHIFLQPHQATHVSVEFRRIDSGTSVRLINSGFEVFDEATAKNRIGRVQDAWETLVELYRAAV